MKRIITVICLALLMCGLAAAQDLNGVWKGFLRDAKVVPANAAYNWDTKKWNFNGTLDYILEMEINGDAAFTGSYNLILASNWRLYSKFELTGSYKANLKQMQWSKGKLLANTIGANVCKTSLTSMTYSEAGDYEYLKGLWTTCDNRKLPVALRREKGKDNQAEPLGELEYFELGGVKAEFPKNWTNKRDDAKKLISSASPDGSVLVYLKQTDETVFDEVNSKLVDILQDAYAGTYTELKEGDTEHDVGRNGLSVRVVTYTAKEDGVPVNITVQFAKPSGDDSKVVLLVSVGTQEGAQKYAAHIITILEKLGAAVN